MAESQMADEIPYSHVDQIGSLAGKLKAVPEWAELELVNVSNIHQSGGRARSPIFWRRRYIVNSCILRHYPFQQPRLSYRLKSGIAGQTAIKR
ncbi:hypothetical protein [Coleofasciculus sp. E1-EBD-02]|uniref:hypothetical protein n=1 Tax=Coleofasciculus sp. E1-EBD-02 TaxID=3068481 RepID=UPI0032FE392C